MVQERADPPHPDRIYEIRTVLVVQKVFLSLELTFAAHWDLSIMDGALCS